MAAITIRKSAGNWVVRAYGAVIGESSATLVLEENNHADVVYFPRDDIGMEFLERSPTVTHAPYKGEATHYGISTPEGTMPDAAWSYDAPLEDAVAIAGFIAFDTDKVTVEHL